MTPRLRIHTQLSRISENGTKFSLPDYQRELPFKSGVFREFDIIDNSQVNTQITPLVIPVDPLTKGVFIQATYSENYLTDNIAKGDPAIIQVEFDESALWLEASGFNLENFTPTHIKIKAVGDKKIQVERTICAG
ncbi:hypothetical protein [Leptospira sp. GIMC2001]|uniref:hypothetical protein n=1 Tax=Leptospira sp. GIMC2001 TaxID=1513297 RepID=UPI002349FB77|nr:hypothetical protein [Leptospira sp. GIMC2001]WCL51512.1 hypothetical protein O4O04_20055 [Leptospira sp. GIMC2001]